MTVSNPKVLIVCNQRMRDVNFLPSDLERLSIMAAVEWLHLEGGPQFGPNEDPGAVRQLMDAISDVDCIVISHGSPMIGADVMDLAPNLKMIGELEGDRFAYRIDLESAWERGIRTVDTTQGSSYPVAEWALALILISLRNAGRASGGSWPAMPASRRRTTSSTSTESLAESGWVSSGAGTSDAG